MIVKMQKAFIVARKTDRESVLNALRELGVVHLQPVDPGAAVATEQTLTQIDQLARAIQVLSRLESEGPKPDLSALEAANEVLRIQRDSAENRSRLSALHREVEQLQMWGEVRLEQLEQLHSSGIDVKFYSAQKDQLDEFSGELVQVIRELPAKRCLVALVTRSGGTEPEIPETAQPIELPTRDRPTIRDEAQNIDRQLKQDTERLGRLANLVPQMARTHGELQEQAAYTVADRGGLAHENLYAIQGYVPLPNAATLERDLTAAGIDAGVQVTDVETEELPPTLIRYPGWATPIKGLFDVLGTLPGYNEMDVSPFFMIALPLFAAMLIGDAGYGLIFLIVPLLFYRKLAAKAGKEKAQLLIVLGAATIIWGVLGGNIFGVSPKNFMSAGGFWATIGAGLDSLQVIRGDVTQQAQTIMKLSFIFAAIHLSVGQMRQFITMVPHPKALEKLGWAIFLWGIFLIIWYLFFGSQQSPPRPPHWLALWLLAIGTGLTILFSSPSRNPIKTIALGVANFPLSALATFSDSISYIRLMGVGLASTIIGQTFNSLGMQVAEAATWFVGGFVVLFGHSLNIAMCMIAILAHGVRLNMLEFSNNAGVQWAGYPYEPFALPKRKEP